MWLIDTLQGGGTTGIGGWLMLILSGLFWIWMMIDSVRKGEYAWSALLFFFSLFAAVMYFFYVYRQSGPSSMAGFQLPGAQSRKRIRELQAQIHHLDKAHHHSQLGDVYFQQGKLPKAEAAYRAAYQRDAEDLDTRSHLGQCLLRQGRAAEGLPFLDEVCREDPKHEYGYTQMAYAEALAQIGEKEKSIAVWRGINEQHSYTRARVQLAELLIERKEMKDASQLIREVMVEDPHVPTFQRRRDRVWMRRAKALWRRHSLESHARAT